MFKRLIPIKFWLDIFLDDFLYGYDFLYYFFNMHWFFNVDRLEFDLVFGFFLVSELDLHLVELVVKSNNLCPTCGVCLLYLILFQHQYP